MASVFMAAWTSARHSWKADGAKATWQRARMFAGQRLLGATPDLAQHRYLLSQRVAESADYTVKYGPFAGTRLAPESWWSAADRGAMILGFYESEVLEELASLCDSASVLVDVGAADGYYAVGCLKSGLVRSAVCFEMTDEGRTVIATNAERNAVAGRMTILGMAQAGFLDEIPAHLLGDGSECVFLFDIEGGEFELLSSDVLAKLAKARIIIEIHEPMGPDGQAAALEARVRQYFRVKELQTGSRNPGEFQELAGLNDDDRWLLCSESRAYLMRWLVCTPL